MLLSLYSLYDVELSEPRIFNPVLNKQSFILLFTESCMQIPECMLEIWPVGVAEGKRAEYPTIRHQLPRATSESDTKLME